MYGSVDVALNTHAPNHYLRIDEHGSDPYGEEANTLYDFTGFYSRIYDLQFWDDCSSAAVFMETTELNPEDNSQLSNNDIVSVIMQLDLDNPTDKTGFNMVAKRIPAVSESASLR